MSASCLSGLGLVITVIDSGITFKCKNNLIAVQKINDVLINFVL
jgi:hypothetical protein